MPPGLPKEKITPFRRALAKWYRLHARSLPWRETKDPYRIWVSEIMLQQTRVNAVIDHYKRFLAKFPTVFSLALAPEQEVLAAWSGLGYYRRARMLHKAAQFITQELDGRFPTNSVDLRTLPGIGGYTSAAIASIAFGESIAVVDGNVERVLLRITGRPEDRTASGRRFISEQADALVPPKRSGKNRPGDHNQAMMELGAMVCLPKQPLCLQCPVYRYCETRGEHKTTPRTKMRSSPVAYVYNLRRKRSAVEVMMHQRPAEASLMPGMYELPEIPNEAVVEQQPMLRMRHAITNTNYYVQVVSADSSLVQALPLASQEYQWLRIGHLADLPLTGLTRKILRRLHVIAGPGLPHSTGAGVVRQ